MDISDVVTVTNPVVFFAFPSGGDCNDNGLVGFAVYWFCISVHTCMFSLQRCAGDGTTAHDVVHCELTIKDSLSISGVCGLPPILVTTAGQTGHHRSCDVLTVAGLLRRFFYNGNVRATCWTHPFIDQFTVTTPNRS